MKNVDFYKIVIKPITVKQYDWYGLMGITGKYNYLCREILDIYSALIFSVIMPYERYSPKQTFLARTWLI